MFQKRNSIKGRLLPAASVLALASAMATTADAAEYNWGDMSVSVDTTINAALGIRTVNPDGRYIAVSNGGTNAAAGAENTDDGSQNFQRGDVYSASVRAVHDIEMSFGNFGAFTRFSYFYDGVNNDADSTRRTDLSSSTRRRAGRGIDLFDAYVYGDFSVADMPVSVRLGNQVVNWGEALFRTGGISQTNALDVIKVVTPGAELREGYLPSPMIWANAAITPQLSLEAYYQFQWRQTRLVPVGVFHSTEDLFGPGAEGLFLAGDPGGTGSTAAALLASPFGTGVSKISDIRPDDQGQWGIAARYYLEDYSTEMSLFYMNYHAKTPYFGGDATRVLLPFPPFVTVSLDDYFASFPEDIDLYGASFSFPVGDVAFGVEASYQPDFPVPLESGLTQAATDALLAGGSVRNLGAAEMDKFNAIANAQVSIGPGMPIFGTATEMLGADSINFITEVGMVDFKGSQPAGTRGDNFAWGYHLDANATFSNAFGTDIALTPGVSFFHDVNGLSLDRAATGNYTENRRGLSLKLDASYDNDLTAGIAYTNNMGGGTNAKNSDRDYITFTASYSF